MTFFGRFAVQRLLYRVQRQNGSLDLGRGGVARHGDVGALLTVNLHR